MWGFFLYSWVKVIPLTCAHRYWRARPMRRARPGGTHIFGRTGMCCPNGSLFYKKSLHMGPVFLPKISLNMGQLFWLSPKLCDFWGFAMRKPQKSRNFWKIGLFLKKKPLKWVPFLAKITLKDGYGFWGSSGTPLSNSNLSTPRGHSLHLLHLYCIQLMWMLLSLYQFTMETGLPIWWWL